MSTGGWRRQYQQDCVGVSVKEMMALLEMRAPSPRAWWIAGIWMLSLRKSDRKEKYQGHKVSPGRKATERSHYQPLSRVSISKCTKWEFRLPYHSLEKITPQKLDNSYDARHSEKQPCCRFICALDSSFHRFLLPRACSSFHTGIMALGKLSHRKKGLWVKAFWGLTNLSNPNL